MYIQITTRCNMSCAHCCMDAKEKGEDMTLEVFEAALDLGDEFVTLGGGEPTLHPDFEKFLLLAIARSEGVHVITNGKEKERALILAKLARAGIIGAELSRDDYHEEIDDDVVEAFTIKDGSLYEARKNNDQRGIRNVTGNEVMAGRCDFGKDDCCCSDTVIQPNGDAHPCGCLDSPCIANVLKEPDAYDMIWNYHEDNGLESGECYKQATSEEDQ